MADRGSWPGGGRHHAPIRWPCPAEKACQHVVTYRRYSTWAMERERAAIDWPATRWTVAHPEHAGAGRGAGGCEHLARQTCRCGTGATPGWRQTLVPLDNQGAMREASPPAAVRAGSALLYITQPRWAWSSRIERTEASRALVSPNARQCGARCRELAAEQATRCWTRHSPICCQAGPSRASAARVVAGTGGWSRCGWLQPSRAWGGLWVPTAGAGL